MKSLYDYCMENGSDLLSQWHPTKNGNLTPSDISFGAERKVWWQCEHGHEWQAPIYARAGSNRSDGCPVCAGKVILPGVNDLAFHAPDIAKQWHPTQNGELKPDGVSPYSNRKVWWICEQGHPYQAIVSHRFRSHTGCPYCTGRKVLPGFNDLATKHPDLAKQWHPDLNGDLKPTDITPGSNKKVWWKCLGGHSWQAVVFSRTGKRPTGCPYCAGKKQEVDETEELGMERRCHHE